MNIFKFNTNHKASTSIQDDIKAARAMRNALQPSRTDVIKTQELNSENLEILLGLSKDIQVMADGTQPDLLKQITTLRNEVSALRDTLEDYLTRPEVSNSKPATSVPSVRTDSKERPPRPELTGNAKKLFWILNNMSHFTNKKIHQHLNKRYNDTYGESFVSSSGLTQFKRDGVIWNKSAFKWYNILSDIRCKQTIPFAYELLAPAKQKVYDEMFGKPQPN